jgi:hypothetical protein
MHPKHQYLASLYRERAQYEAQGRDDRVVVVDGEIDRVETEIALSELERVESAVKEAVVAKDAVETAVSEPAGIRGWLERTVGR